MLNGIKKHRKKKKPEERKLQLMMMSLTLSQKILMEDLESMLGFLF
jgi:hypothetical protein